MKEWIFLWCLRMAISAIHNWRSLKYVPTFCITWRSLLVSLLFSSSPQFQWPPQITTWAKTGYTPHQYHVTVNFMHQRVCHNDQLGQRHFHKYLSCKKRISTLIKGLASVRPSLPFLKQSRLSLNVSKNRTLFLLNIWSHNRMFPRHVLIFSSIYRK